MQTFITINENFAVIEVVVANVATGFFTAPREDIKVGDVLTEYEKMLLALIPWDDNLVPAEPVAPDPDPRITTSIDVPAEPVAPDPDPRITTSIDVPADSSST